MKVGRHARCKDYDASFAFELYPDILWMFFAVTPSPYSALSSCSLTSLAVCLLGLGERRLTKAEAIQQTPTDNYSRTCPRVTVKGVCLFSSHSIFSRATVASWCHQSNSSAWNPMPRSLACA